MPILEIRQVISTMAKLPEEFISQLKSANDIVDLFSTYADLKKRGRVYVCCCPFHAEKTASCTIYPENNSFYCFGCGTGGDIIKFIRLTDNVSYMEAVRTLAQRCGMTLPSLNPKEIYEARSREKCYEINRETANFYYQQLLQGEDKRGLQYLKQYQILPATVRKYAIGFAPDNWYLLHNHLKQKGYSDKEIFSSGVCRKNQNGKLYDYFRNRLIFPVVDLRGNVTAFCGMSVSQEQSLFLYTENTPVSDRSRVLFSLHFARNENNTKKLILAENYFNAIAIHQAGFANVIAVPDLFTANHAKLIAQYAEEVILLSGNAVHYGDMQTVRNQLSAVSIPVRIVHLQNAFDSAEFIRNYGTEQFRDLLDNAGDAIQFALKNSWDGLDTEHDRTAMIQKSAQVLSSIRDNLEREVYLTETARKFNLTPEQMQSELDRISHRKVNFHAHSSRSLQKEELSAGKSRLREHRAEEQILVYLIRFPETSPVIQKKLKPEAFLTELYKKTYQLLCENQTDISVLEQNLSPEEWQNIRKIIKKYQEFELTAKSTDDCINVLHNAGKQVIC